MAARHACDSDEDCLGYSLKDDATAVTGEYQLYFRARVSGSDNKCGADFVDYSSPYCLNEYNCFLKQQFMSLAVGDPHMTRLDGLQFDLDMAGSYVLLQFPQETGADMQVKTEVGEAGAHGVFNLVAEFTGAWVDNHKVTVSGKRSDTFGVVVDGELTPFEDMASELTLGYTSIVPVLCDYKLEVSEWSQNCKERAGKHVDKVRGRTFKYIEFRTPAGVVTTKHKGRYIDVFFDAGNQVRSVGGLLGTSVPVRKSTPLHASSIASDGEDSVQPLMA